MKTKVLSILAAILALTLLLTACNQPITTLEEGKDAVGTLLLSINPEIEIEYDRNGLVIEVEGRNQDGKEILLSYQDFAGKTVKQVMTELVEAIYASGKYQLEMDGNDKNIVIKLEKGSAYPNDQFLEEIAECIRLVVESQGKQSEAVVVDKKDLTQQGFISLEKAKELVLTQLGLTEADFSYTEYKLDDGKYELEFHADGVEYEYEVDAVTGKILEVDVDTKPPVPAPTVPAPQPSVPNSPATNPPAAAGITLQEAKAIVFAHLGITEADILDAEFELDDGRYELDFQIGNVEYEIEVDAATGRILKLETEIDDDHN